MYTLNIGARSVQEVVFMYAWAAADCCYALEVKASLLGQTGEHSLYHCNLCRDLGRCLDENMPSPQHPRISRPRQRTVAERRITQRGTKSTTVVQEARRPFVPDEIRPKPDLLDSEWSTREIDIGTSSAQLHMVCEYITSIHLLTSLTGQG